MYHFIVPFGKAYFVIRKNIFDEVRKVKKSFLTPFHIKNLHVKSKKFINDSVHS